MIKECGRCVYKYSCGYGAKRSNMETRECAVPTMFKAKRKRVFSFVNQRMEPENKVRIEEGLSP